MKKIILVIMIMVMSLSFFSYGKYWKSMGNILSSSMKISSSAFMHNGLLPKKYTCEGVDISPPLEWSNVFEEAQSLALICDDPDARGKTWVHWVVYNIPCGTKGLAEKADIAAIGAQEGKNDFGKIGYDGPCPPRGDGIHHYQFTLFALDIRLNVANGVTKKELLQAMQGHVLGEAQIVGIFKRV